MTLKQRYAKIRILSRNLLHMGSSSMRQLQQKLLSIQALTSAQIKFVRTWNPNFSWQSTDLWLAAATSWDVHPQMVSKKIYSMLSVLTTLCSQNGIWSELYWGTHNHTFIVKTADRWSTNEIFQGGSLCELQISFWNNLQWFLRK